MHACDCCCIVPIVRFCKWGVIVSVLGLSAPLIRVNKGPAVLHKNFDSHLPEDSCSLLVGKSLGEGESSIFSTPEALPSRLT